ncbi:MAG: GNAT family N-acetyltransferase [Lachnospiraceae bacterium]|nr:GNAT family N-acetyltransferase [Lachnospiraceae bacterium]
MESHIYRQLSQAVLCQIEALHAACMEKVSGPSELGLVLPEADTEEEDSFYALYYIEDTLVSFLSCFCPDGKTAEISGFTAPGFRNRGLFSILLREVKKETKKVFGNVAFLFQCLSSESDTVSFCKSRRLTFSHSECIMEWVPKKESSGRLSSSILSSSDFAPLIRLVPSGEYETFTSLHRRVFEVSPDFSADYIDMVSRDKETTSYLICQNDDTVGLFHLTFSKNSLNPGQAVYLMGFGILPEHRRKGLAKAALKALPSLMPEHSRLFLQVSTLNAAAFSLYENFGFQISSRLDYFS